MKLKTKFQDDNFELGEIVDAEMASVHSKGPKIKVETTAKIGGIHTFFYDSLREFMTEWEEDSSRPVWESTAETVKLPCGIEIATTDYWEYDEDDDRRYEFTFSEANALEEKLGGHWRVPTEAEWFLICGSASNSKEPVTSKRLNDLIKNVPESGSYWSSTVYSGTYGYYLSFNSTRVCPALYYSRSYGFPVRLIKVGGKQDNH